MKKIEESFEIELSEDGEVFVSTQIGNGHIGGGNLKFEDDPSTKIAKGMLTDFPLHHFGPLKDRTLIVTTNGLDQNPSSDRIPIKHSFSGNGLVSRRSFPFVSESEDHSVISFVIRYTFK